MDDWKQRALADPSLTDKQVKVLLHGPKSLAQSWILQALKFKYGRFFD